MASRMDKAAPNPRRTEAIAILGRSSFSFFSGVISEPFFDAGF
jgi:hypothetical protein